MKSLTMGGFSGMIVPVNPKATVINGIKTSPSVSDYPGPIDLAIVVVPAKGVPAVFQGMC